MDLSFQYVDHRNIEKQNSSKLLESQCYINSENRFTSKLEPL
jgi:hypothetical protein